MDVEPYSAKRVRLTPPASAHASLDTNADYVAFDLADEDFRQQAPHDAPTGPHTQLNGNTVRRREDPRNRFDRPKTKHALPGVEAWILVKTKLGRRFVHNINTKQSLWRVPRQLQDTVEAFDIDEEKKRNAQWSEDQLTLMRQKQAAAAATSTTNNDNTDDRTQRRRSESLQREDEAAMMAELAAQAEHAEEQDAKRAAQAVGDIEPRGYLGEASDSEYEYVEVTDTEGEDHVDDLEDAEPMHAAEDIQPSEPGPVDFGEDDIAYQLAMMGESYGLDPEEYGDPDIHEEDGYDDEEGLPISDDEAYALFCQMLEEHEVSPFLPWDKLISDESASSIVFDERYTVLTSSKARKEAWDRWSRERAATLKVQRALEEKKDTRIAFLFFLAQNASTKLYWPEFKRKYKREPEMNDRAMQDKDREKYYRDLVAKLKLPVSKREDELKALLQTVRKDTSMPRVTLPSKVTTNVLLYALAPDVVSDVVRSVGYEPQI